jgi:hypothetical protein
MSDHYPPPRRSRLPMVVALLIMGILAAITGGIVVLGVVEKPDAAAAETLAEDYVEALNRGDCSHYDYLSDGYLQRQDTSLEKCKQSLEFEPAFFEFELVEVRVDGDEGEIEIEAANDVGEVTMIASLAVQDGEWKVDALHEVED